MKDAEEKRNLSDVEIEYTVCPWCGRSFEPHEMFFIEEEGIDVCGECDASHYPPKLIS